MTSPSMHHAEGHPVSAAFAPIIGLTAWRVRKGHGSFVTIEFGQPELRVEEPKTRAVRFGSSDIRELRTRTAVVGGQWHLWIYCCSWVLSINGAELANWESDDVTIERALKVLNGQALVNVEITTSDSSTTFAFDLGCVLETRPIPEGSDDEPGELWTLYEPSGQTLSVRDDGLYCVENGGADEWLPLPESGS